MEYKNYWVIKVNNKNDYDEPPQLVTGFDEEDCYNNLRSHWQIWFGETFKEYKKRMNQHGFIAVPCTIVTEEPL